MTLIIRKRVSLEFLGEEYKEAFVIFKSIPVKDFESMQNDIESIQEDNKKSLSYIIEMLKKYFLSGKAPNESGELADIAKEDLDELDATSIIRCFEALTGQSINEESNFLDKSSTMPSPTDQPSQSS